MSDQLYENVNSYENIIPQRHHKESYINNNDCPTCKPCELTDHERVGWLPLITIVAVEAAIIGTHYFYHKFCGKDFFDI